MDESEIKNVINKMVKKYKNGGMIDCLRNGGSYGECKKCEQQKVVKNQNPAEPLGSKTDGMGLPVQLPERGDDLKYTNIISNGLTGKAATWIPKNGRKQITRFIMADNNPDVPGYANDIQMEIDRDPRTGALQDTLLRNKILPGVWLPGLPIRLRSDADIVRNAKKRK